VRARHVLAHAGATLLRRRRSARHRHRHRPRAQRHRSGAAQAKLEQVVAFSRAAG